MARVRSQACRLAGSHAHGRRDDQGYRGQAPARARLEAGSRRRVQERDLGPSRQSRTTEVGAALIVLMTSGADRIVWAPASLAWRRSAELPTLTPSIHASTLPKRSTT